MVNTLLDDGSIKSYVNSDVTFQLGTLSSKNTIWVSQWQTGYIRCNASGIDGGDLVWKSEARNTNVYSETSEVTNGMKVINWNKHKDKWNHSKGIVSRTIKQKAH